MNALELAVLILQLPSLEWWRMGELEEIRDWLRMQRDGTRWSPAWRLVFEGAIRRLAQEEVMRVRAQESVGEPKRRGGWPKGKPRKVVAEGGEVTGG